MNVSDSLKEWQLDNGVSNVNRLITLSIGLKYPNAQQFIEFGYKERVKKIDLTYKVNLKKLIALGIFNEHEVLGPKKRPTGIKTTIKFNQLDILNQLDFVDRVSITSITDATKIVTDEIISESYFCVKMTVVIDIEGMAKKRQGIEQRFVLVKASSSDDAYDKLDKQKNKYAAPYLNSDGRFVRWRIESFDDCYQTDIFSPDDINKSEGVEVYSKLKSRRTKSKTAWDGRP